MTYIRVLQVEDNADDAFLVLDALRRFGFEITSQSVETEEAMSAALTNHTWDVVIGDYRLPRFNGPAALRLTRSIRADLPFILVSATIGDELAVEMMQMGAQDYVMKDRLARLGPAVDRELRERANRYERKVAEEALRDMQRRFQATFEHRGVGIAHSRRGGELTLVNDRFCEMLGYAREDLLTLSFNTLTHAEDRASMVEALARLASGDISVYRGEQRYVRNGGGTIWVTLTVSSVRDVDGVVDYYIGVVEDISQRKHAEERIQFQARLLDVAEQAVIATDLSGTITYWNGFAEKLYGWPAAEAIGHHALKLVNPALCTVETRAIMTRLVGGESWSGEVIVQRRDGVQFPAMVIDSPLFDGKGEITGVVGVSFDLTAPKSAIEALSRSEERYRSVVEGVGDIMISLDPNGIITSLNGAFEKITGWDRSEWSGRPFWELIAENDPAMVKERFARLVCGETLGPIEHSMRTRNGRNVVIEEVAYTRLQHGRVVEIFIVGRDVSEKQAVEAERVRLAKEVSLLLESTDEGIYAVDRNGNCTLVNRAAGQMLGYSEAELRGRNMHDLIQPKRGDGSTYDQADCPIYRVLRTGSTERVRDEYFWKSDGLSIPVEYAAAPIIDDGQVQGAVITFTDITQRRLLESQLERANRIHSLGRLAGTMAHEFNNVLMGIQPFAEIVGRDPGATGKTKEAVQRITSSVSRGKRVTEEILRFTRGSEPVLKGIRVDTWVDGLAMEAQAILGPAVQFWFDCERDVVILGDSNQLHQIVLNLVVNARDAIKGAGSVTLKVSVPTENTAYAFGVIDHVERFAHFELSDTGQGMSAETLRHIFEPLFTTKRSGTGLGLALAHQVVKQHHGHIFAETEQGRGSTFHIFLPLTAVQPVKHDDASRRLAPPRSTVRRLVLVEDDESVAAGLVDLLQSEGVSVAHCTLGRAAVPMIASTDPDGVILDVGLPDVDGTDLYLQIQERWPDLPVLFSTGHADVTRLESYVGSQTVGYLLKPYDMSALLQALGRWHSRSSSQLASTLESA